MVRGQMIGIKPQIRLSSHGVLHTYYSFSVWALCMRNAQTAASWSQVASIRCGPKSRGEWWCTELQIQPRNRLRSTPVIGPAGGPGLYIITTTSPLIEPRLSDLGQLAQLSRGPARLVHLLFANLKAP